MTADLPADTLARAMVKFDAVDRNEWLEKLILTGDEARAVAAALRSLRDERDTLAKALRGVDAILDDFAAGRIEAFVALGKIGVTRLYPDAVLSEEPPAVREEKPA